MKPSAVCDVTNPTQTAQVFTLSNHPCCCGVHVDSRAISAHASRIALDSRVLCSKRLEFTPGPATKSVFLSQIPVQRRQTASTKPWIATGDGTTGTFQKCHSKRNAATAESNIVVFFVRQL